MNTYTIKIYNGSGVLVYQYKDVTAKDENEALMAILTDISICDGDTINIEQN